MKVFGGFDGHGSSTAVAVAKAKNIPLTDVYIKYPDTSAEGLPKLLYSLNLYNEEINIFDIPVNVKDPMGWIQIMSIIANNNKVTLYDHHESNLKFISQLPANLKLIQFSNAAEMAKAIHETFGADLSILMMGVICDRDPAIRTLIDVESREFAELYDLANKYDTIIRQNLQTAIQGLYTEGLEYVRRLTINYPPAQLADQVLSSARRIDNIIYADVTNVSLGPWIWKTFDEVLRRTGADYMVAIATVLDRQINAQVPAVFVVKYWLSTAPSPKPMLSNIIANRKVIGHDDGFSISTTSTEDARQLADQIVNALQSRFSSVASAINSNIISRAIQNDFAKILSKLAEILEEQKKMYEQYLDLKKQQVELLKQSNDENRRRYD